MLFDGMFGIKISFMFMIWITDFMMWVKSMLCYIQLNLVDSKSSGPRKILRNTEASDKRIMNIHVYLSEKYFSCKKYVETENTFEL